MYLWPVSHRLDVNARRYNGPMLLCIVSLCLAC
jgi:hypothetical protein